MTFNFEKLQEIVKPRSEAAIKRAQFRKENRELLSMLQEIELLLHYYRRIGVIG